MTIEYFFIENVVDALDKHVACIRDDIVDFCDLLWNDSTLQTIGELGDRFQHIDPYFDKLMLQLDSNRHMSRFLTQYYMSAGLAPNDIIPQDGKLGDLLEGIDLLLKAFEGYFDHIEAIRKDVMKNDEDGMPRLTIFHRDDIPAS